MKTLDSTLELACCFVRTYKKKGKSGDGTKGSMIVAKQKPTERENEDSDDDVSFVNVDCAEAGRDRGRGRASDGRDVGRGSGVVKRSEPRSEPERNAAMAATQRAAMKKVGSKSPVRRWNIPSGGPEEEQVPSSSSQKRLSLARGGGGGGGGGCGGVGGNGGGRLSTDRVDSEPTSVFAVLPLKHVFIGMANLSVSPEPLELRILVKSSDDNYICFEVRER